MFPSASSRQISSSVRWRWPPSLPSRSAVARAYPETAPVDLDTFRGRKR